VSAAWRDGKTGRFRACRVRAFQEIDDPMNEYVGGDVIGELVNDMRRRDVRDGCPACRAEVLENASEPDVLARMGFRS